MSLNNSLPLNNECCDINLTTLVKNNDVEQWTYEEIVFLLLESIVAIFAMLGNVLVIIVFLRERRLRRKTNYYIISLVSADFCVGLLGIPFAIFWLSTGSPVNNFFCLLPILTLFTLCNISVFSLLLISIDRIMSINLPLNGALSSKNVAIEISSCWGLGIVIGFLPVIWHKGETKVETCSIHDVMTDGYLLFRFVFVILIPALSMAFIYFNIYKIIIRQMKNEAVLKKPPANYGIVDQKRPEEFLIKREVRATLNISLIVIIFIILWIPLHIVYILPIFCKSCFISRTTTALAISVAHSNSAINPLLYAYHMRDIRRAIFKLLGLNKQQIITCKLIKK